MGKLLVGDGKYMNTNVVNNVVRYITRTRPREMRRGELRGYGALGIALYSTPERMIEQICYVQNLYGINQRGGRRIYHEFYRLSEEEEQFIGTNNRYLNIFALECSQLYYSAGFQVVYAIHYDEEKRTHIHFCVSVINFYTGKKWHDYHSGVKEREAIFEAIGKKYQNMIVPIEWN